MDVPIDPTFFNRLIQDGNTPEWFAKNFMDLLQKDREGKSMYFMGFVGLYVTARAFRS